MRYCLLLLVYVALFSCAVNKERKWANVTIDKSLNKDWNMNYREKEDTNIVMRNEIYNQSQLKTIHVSYFKLGRRDKEHWIENESINNCQVSIPKSDSLVIRIGYDFIGLGGSGFVIHFKNRKFYVLPYEHYSCGSSSMWPRPEYKIRVQELVLDKPSYNIGDSLYGRVYFHITETKKYLKELGHYGKKKNEHYASGNFRAIVKDNLFW